MKPLAILILIVSVAACAGNKYEGYSNPLVVSSVEYEGRHDSLWCRGDFDCDKGTLECIYHYHGLASEYIGKAKILLKRGIVDTAVVIEFYNAWCRLQQAKQYIVLLEYESPKDFAILVKAGLIQQTKIVSTILAIKIKQLEDGRI
jgi:hypothetical protein